MIKQIYIYSWGRDEKRESLKGRPCFILIEDSSPVKMCLVKFTDNNQYEVCSKRCLVRK